MSLSFLPEKRYSFPQTIYSACYKDIFSKTNNIVTALKAALSLYIDNLSSKENNAPLLRELKKYFKHLKSATVGNIIYQYAFNVALPSDLKALLDQVKQFEIKKIFAPNEEYRQIKNEVFAQNHSPKSVYAGLAKLGDLALKLKSDDNMSTIVKNNQLGQINALVNEWEELSKEKFALLIFQATSEESLTKQFNLCFPPDLAQTHENLEEISLEFDCQIEYLSDKDFFNHYYNLKTLEEKYDFVYLFQQKEGKCTEELEETLDCLLIHIAKSAFVRFEKKMLSLMQSATLQEVMSQLDEHMSAKKESRLKNVLKTLLAQKQSEYEGWQRVDALKYPALPTMRPLYQIHVGRFATSDPDLCAAEHLERLNPKIVM